MQTAGERARRSNQQNADRNSQKQAYRTVASISYTDRKHPMKRSNKHDIPPQYNTHTRTI